MALVFGSILIIIAALLVLGAYLPSTPYLGVFGSALLSLFPGWFVAGALIGTGAVFWGGGSSVARSLMIGLGLLAALGASVVVYRLVSTARFNGVHLSVAHAFGGQRAMDSGSADEEVTYGHNQEEALKLWVYRPGGMPPSSGWPVLMYVHGGGWVEGSAEDRSADLRWFAEQGWMVLAVDYSLSSESRHLWDQVHAQIGCAMAWAAANLEARGGDISRLALTGESAGGNLVLNAAYLANAGTLPTSCGGRVPMVSAVAALYPGVDLVAIHGNKYPWVGKGVRKMVTSYVGGPPSQFPDRYKAVASASHINPAAPPTLLFISENDHLVPLASMRAFDREIRRAGVQTRTVSVPHAEHGFDMMGIGNAVFRQVTLQFLREHVGATSGHPKGSAR